MRKKVLAVWCCFFGLILGCSATPSDHEVFRTTIGKLHGTKPAVNFGVPRQLTWLPADIRPCTLILASEAEAILGPLNQSPHPGGTAIDGTACIYVARNAVVSLGVLSTMAFESRKCDPWNVAIEDLGVDAYAVPLSGGDLQLLVRTSQSAAAITLTIGRAVPNETRLRMLTDLAVTALRRLPS